MNNEIPSGIDLRTLFKIAETTKDFSQQEKFFHADI
jgi:hypothetical protein